MRIFVTGGTGYLGSALVRRLVDEGHEARCLVRPGNPAGASRLRALGAACFEGDVTDRYSLREGMSGADWVVHAAADLDPSARAERLARVNVAGSENVASLAFKLGVGRLLSVSSVAYFGGSPDDGSEADEDSPVRLPLPSAYGATKHAGERAIQRWAREGLAVNTVFPSLVYGPPGKKQGANAVLRRIALGRLPAIVGADRRTRWVFLDDAVDGMTRVLGRAEPGRGFLLTGDLATVEEVVHAVCEVSRVPPPRLRLPVWAARWLLLLTAPLAGLRGRRPMAEREQLASLTRHWNFSDARARRELGWRPRDLREGLAAAVPALLARAS